MAKKTVVKKKKTKKTSSKTYTGKISYLSGYLNNNTAKKKKKKKSTLKPVSVGGIEFSALISSEHSFESVVPEYPVESGFTVSDAIILGQETLSLVLYLTDTPVTWSKRHGIHNGRSAKAIEKLRTLYYSRKPVTVVTSEKTYKNMVIEQMTITKNEDTGLAREIPITFRQIRFTKAKKTTIPSSYGKSQKTKSNAGSANTGSGSSGGGSSGGGSSGGSSGTSSASSKSKATEAKNNPKSTAKSLYDKGKTLVKSLTRP